MSEGVEGQSAAEKHEFPCQACGASLEFAPGAGELKCTYCGHRQELEREVTKPIVEYSFDDARRKAKKVQARDLVKSGHEVRCDGCGARSVLEGQASRCPFCDSPVVLAPQDDELFAPESLLPFAVDTKRAKEVFQAWIKSRWFAPSNLAERASRRGLDGVFLPYWTYDSQTTTRYAGMRGTHYYVTERYRDSDGKERTRQVRKTRWWPASGTVYVPFDDVLVAATKSLPRSLLEKLEPWDLHALSPWQPGFLSGFTAERYSVELEEGFGIAEERMEPNIRRAIMRDIGGDDQRILSMRVQHSDVTFKHFLLPLWISSFRYGDKVYRFLVNARTGEAAGERPYSVLKITLAALAAIALAIVLWLVFKE